MVAGELGQSHSFVRDLLRERLPDGVRLVVLCRSHRQNILDPPSNALRLELKPFTRAETAAHLRQTFPSASDPDVEEFHRLSSENPRVQALALYRRLSLSQTLRLLGPNPTTVEDSIGSLLQDSIAAVQDSAGAIERDEIEKVCTALAVLRPRVPISTLSRVSGVSEDWIRSMILDLGRPLHLAEDSAQFLDEPVETWFRETFKPSQEELIAFIDRLTPLAAESAYVASTLPQLMLEAGQLTELLGLALTSTRLPETSELEKQEVELHRLQFALKASLRQKRYVDAAKLAMKAGQATAGDDLNRKIIRENTDIATRCIEPDRIQELVSRRTFASGWMGSHHAYEAGLLSGRGAFSGDARSRLRMAYEWLDNWKQLTSEEREEESVVEADIVELTMAELNVHGPAAAAASVGRWRPRQVAFRVGRIVASRLVDHGRIDDLNDVAVAAESNVLFVVAIIVELHNVQQTPPRTVVERAFKYFAGLDGEVVEEDVEDIEGTTVAAVTAVVQAALEVSVCTPAEGAAVLSRHLPVSPPCAASSSYSGSDPDLLDAYCLRAELEGKTLQIKDLAHPALRNELEGPQQNWSPEARDFEKQIGALLPWYELWAGTLVGRITKGNVQDRIVRAREAIEDITYYRDESRIANEAAVIWFEVLQRVDAIDGKSIDGLKSWIKKRRQPLYARTLMALARRGAWKEETKPVALEFAKEAFALTRGEHANAETKSGEYISIARSVLAINVREAQGYFDEALAIGGRVGEENLWRWGAILDLAEKGGATGRAGPETAYEFGRCAELTWDYVARDKHFDWQTTVEALSSLCPYSCVAIVSRWRDRGFGWAGRILPVAVRGAVEGGSMDPRDALALVGFEAQWDYVRLLGAVLAACTNRAEQERVTSFLLRYVNLERQRSSFWRGLQRAIAEHGLSVPDLEEHLAIAAREECRADEQSAENEEEWSAAKASKRRWSDLFTGSDLTTSNGIRACYSEFTKTHNPWERDEFFAEAMGRVPAGRETEFIAGLESTTAFDLYELRSVLNGIPDTWKGRPAIEQALASALKVYCQRYCMKIAKSRHYEVLRFDLASQLTGMGVSDIADVVLRSIGDSPEYVNAERAFSMVGLLTSAISQEEALEALEFGLGLFAPILQDRHGDGVWSEALVPAGTMQESIAGYIYAGLAAPKAAVRWEAAHAVLGLCALGRQEVLRHLWTIEQADSVGPFVDARLPFYRLHARQWLLIGFARAATEFPETVAPFADRLVELAHREQPHVMVRMFAARAAMALIENGVLPDGGLMEHLSGVNVSSLPVVESKWHGRVNREANRADEEREEDRYYFGLDMGRYWYEPLGRIFGLSQGDVEDEALAVIRRDLNSLAKNARKEDERERRKLYDHRETYASHGAYPDTDDLQFYLSYHAMMVVAGRLLATRATRRDVGSGNEDEFPAWLSRHDVSRGDGRWLADRQDPVPRERPSWCNREKDDPEYGVVTTCDFSEALMHGDLMSVWGDWSIADSHRVQSVRVRSALVSPDRSMALLRALTTAQDPRDYLIPSSGDDLEIDQGGFVLRGWIEDSHRDAGLDRKDPWSGRVVYPPPRPAAEVVKTMSLRADSDMRVWSDIDETPLMQSQVWGHLESRSDVSDDERGERLLTAVEFVTQMLRRSDLHMIIEVEIERNGRGRRYESKGDDDERIPEQTRLYVVGHDGHLITL